MIDDATERPVAGATLEILGPSGERVAAFVTDTTGEFVLRVPRAGQFTVRGRALGYRESPAQDVTLLSLDTLRVAFRLSPDAVLLKPLIVEVDRPLTVRTHLIPYYERRNWYGRLGTGRFFDTELQVLWRGVPVTSLLRERGGMHFVPLPGRPGEYLLSGSRDSTCPVAVFIDGVRDRSIGTVRDLELIVIMSQIAAVEVYRPHHVPIDFLAPGGCGAVAIWLH